MSLNLSRAFLVLLFTASVGCFNDPPLPAVCPIPEDAATSGQRLLLSEMHFNRWTDYVPLMGAVDEQCRFLQPITLDGRDLVNEDGEPLCDDWTTPYPPLQFMWLIYEDASDVTHPEKGAGTVISDTFFLGDELNLSMFDPKDDLEPLGFMYITPSRRDLLGFKSSSLSEDGRTLNAWVGGQLNFIFRAQTTQMEDGTCAVETTYCLQNYDDFPDMPCQTEYRPLRRIEVELNFIFLPTGVEFVEE